MNRGGKLAKTAAWVIQHLDVGDTVTLGTYGITPYTVTNILAPHVTVRGPAGSIQTVEAHRIRTITKAGS